MRVYIAQRTRRGTFIYLFITVVRQYSSCNGHPWFTLKMAKFYPFPKNIRVNRLKNIFGTIDYVIDLNNLAKFGYGNIFPDGGIHTQHISQKSNVQSADGNLYHRTPSFYGAYPATTLEPRVAQYRRILTIFMKHPCLYWTSTTKKSKSRSPQQIPTSSLQKLNDVIEVKERL